MNIGTIEVTKFPPYNAKRMTLQQVIIKTCLGSVNGKPRWSSQTKHVKV